MDTPATQTARETMLAEWKAFVVGSGQRWTVPREHIFWAVFDCDSPFEVEALHAAARSRDAAVSLATVYRTIPLLEEGGIIAEAELGGDRHQYVAGLSASQKLFLVCTDCERTIPLKDDCLWLREQFLAKQMGFKPEEISLRIRASCQSRNADGECERFKNGS